MLDAEAKIVMNCHRVLNEKVHWCRILARILEMPVIFVSP